MPPPLHARICGWFCLVVLVCSTPAWPLPRVHLVEQDLVLLTVVPMNVDPAPGSAPLPGPVELEDRGTLLEYRLQWPGPGQASTVELRVTPRPPRSGARHLLLLESRVELPDGSRVRSSREMVFSESDTSLFEVHRLGERALVLAIQAKQERDTRLTVRRETGAPIQFQLEIERLEGDLSESLETNRLNTFVGDPVGYGFQIGSLGEGESLRVRLTPTRLYGDLAQIEIDVSGMLFDGEQTAMISRTEDWMTTRGTTSSLEVAVGQPPRGYRFRVTPWF
jgi:hypothetical protein